jgi:hypothetical protein
MVVQVATSQDGILLNSLSRHPQGSQILHTTLHTCQPRCSSQRDQNCNQFEWAVHELACSLQVLLNVKHMHWSPQEKWVYQDLSPLIAFVGKSALPTQVAHPSHILKLCTPCKNVSCTVSGAITAISAAIHGRIH